MNDPLLLRINLIGAGDLDSTKYFEALEHISSQLYDDAYVHVYKPHTIFVFLRPNFCPSIKQTVFQPGDTVIDNLLLYKHKRGLSEIAESGHVNLNNRLQNNFNASVGQIRQLRYDVISKQFIDKIKSSNIRISKRVQPVVRPVSLTEERRKHDASFSRNKNAPTKKGENLRGYVRVRFDAYHRQDTRRVCPLDSVQHDLPLRHNSRQEFPVQATDGPYENVDFHLSTATANLTLDEPVTTRPRASYRYPDYASETARRLTFATWPHDDTVQNVEELVKNGFFYTGPADLVRCYHCGLGLKDWGPLEDPILEHVRFSPQCLHLEDTVVRDQLDQYRAATAAINNQGTGTGNGHQYRHPEYKAFETRERTFTRWPRNLTQTPDQLAQAGFYYTGFQDQVRCYACDGGLQHWDAEDDPWIEHARWFSHCVHVRTIRGEAFVAMVQAALQDPQEDTQVDYYDENTSAANTEASGGRQESDDPIYHPEAQKVLTNLGFSRAAVKMVIQECADKKMRWNSNILADLLFDKQARGEILPTDSPRPESPVQPEIDVSTDEGAATENRRLLEKVLCIQCETNGTNVLFLPCAHHKMCTDCANDVTMCPICGKTVKQKIKTFMV